MLAPNFAHIVHKPLPKHELPLELAPLPVNLRGFVPRIPAVTAAELAGVDLSYLDLLAEQQRRGDAS